MQTSGEEHQLSAARLALGAGAMLKRAREAANISAADIAARTRLELKVVEALEREDYLSLAAAAFVKGYIRSIARELNIDSAPILAQYIQQAQIEDPALADFSSRSPVQITSSSALIRTISLVLVAIVLALVALWWQHNYKAPAEPTEALTEIPAPGEIKALETGPQPAPTGADKNPATPPLTKPTALSSPAHGLLLPSAPGERSEKPVDKPKEQTPPETPGGPLGQGGSPPQKASVAQAPVTAAASPAVTEPTPMSAEQEPPPEEEAVNATPEPKPAAPSPTASSTGELQLVGRGESWVEVSDVAGKRLYFGMLKRGQKVGVTGKPPYDLLIGNAHRVSATLHGKPIDIRARAVNGVARFSLGEPH